ncbi:MAG: HAD-IIA family hydrolase [Clostridia bacterium]|nr:HAD-IIA family hydrolase [Clostridia bacterium]
MTSLKDKKLFLLDMDGTIYLDDFLFDGTLDFLYRVKEIGGRYLFVTNNSSKSVSAYVEKLNRIGIAAVEDDFLTSTDATIIYIKEKYQGRKFYSFGTESFTNQLRASGIDVATDIEDGIFGIVMGNDNELTFKKLEDACKLLLNDIVYIATNPDWVCPTAFGYVPDCGSVAEMLFRATGKKPRFIGKPEPEMLLLAMEKYGYKKDEAVMVGDRLYTDIASGYNAGIDTVFVLSGEGTLDDLKETKTPPTYVLSNIRELYNEIK